MYSKSTCITLALYTLLTSSTSATSLDTIVSRGHPAIHLPPMLSTSSLPITKETASKNTSMYYYTADNNGSDYNAVKDDDEVDLLDLLPLELVAIIESVRSSDSSLQGSPASSRPSNSRYYATYTDGESCSTKSISEFNSWETRYDTLNECCAKAFGWDYDACMNVKKLSYQTK